MYVKGLVTDLLSLMRDDKMTGEGLKRQCDDRSVIICCTLHNLRMLHAKLVAIFS